MYQRFAIAERFILWPVIHNKKCIQVTTAAKERERKNLSSYTNWCGIICILNLYINIYRHKEEYIKYMNPNKHRSKNMCKAMPNKFDGHNEFALCSKETIIWNKGTLFINIDNRS